MGPHVSGRPEYTAEGGGKHAPTDIAARTRKHDRMQFSHISTLISSGSEDTRRGFDREPDSFRLSSEAQTETRTHGRSSDSFPSRRLPDLDQWQRMPGRTVPCAGRNSQQRKLSPTSTAFPFHRAALPRRRPANHRPYKGNVLFGNTLTRTASEAKKPHRGAPVRNGTSLPHVPETGGIRRRDVRTPR